MEDTEVVLRQTLIEIQDLLAPILDSYEQMLYHYLFRRTYLIGETEAMIGTRSIQTRLGLGIGKAGTPPSPAHVSEKIRSLEQKGCINVLDRSNLGTRVQIRLPSEIPGLIPETQQSKAVLLEELDFYHDHHQRTKILEREGYKCFYCLKSLTSNQFTIDHVESRVSSINHSYKNVVAACFECNSKKRETDVLQFLRFLYRDGLMTSEEHSGRVEQLNLLRAGKLIPKIE
ncbi:MAG: hypothetical protein A2W35_11865 [Chloroflexi bacterium RBG_16_57_11]|nr:MAG: hypothetical protein A2W35_11865 [Chloroflexi bacterium RBG_16_57_11]